jgi:hypothetical protein
MKARRIEHTGVIPVQVLYQYARTDRWTWSADDTGLRGLIRIYVLRSLRTDLTSWMEDRTDASQGDREGQLILQLIDSQ